MSEGYFDEEDGGGFAGCDGECVDVRDACAVPAVEEGFRFVDGDASFDDEDVDARLFSFEAVGAGCSPVEFGP